MFRKKFKSMKKVLSLLLTILLVNLTSATSAITGSSSWDPDVMGTVTNKNISKNGKTELSIMLPKAALNNILTKDGNSSISAPVNSYKESIPSTLKANVRNINIPLPAAPALTITTVPTTLVETDIRSGISHIFITISDDIFSTDLGDDNAVTTALIAGMIDAPIWVANVVSALNYNNVFRLSDTEIRIDIPLVDYFISADEAVNFDVPASVFQNYASNINVNTAFSVVNEATTVSVTGTNQTEADIIDVGSTITLSLTGNEWDDQIDAGGAVTTALLNGITGSTSWNDDVIGKVTPTIVTNGTTEITITFPAAADYSISAQDVISVSVPTTCLKWSESSAIAGDVSLNIIPIPATVDISTNKNDGSYFMESEIRSGSAQIIIAVSNDIFSTDVGDDNAVTTALIAGMIDAPIWVANVVSALNYNNVFRLSDTEIRIDIPVVDYYISADEAVNFDVPASVFQNYASNINVNTAFSVVNEATTVSVTGTNQTEADIIDVGSTITLSLTGNEWDDQIDAGGAVTTALLNGITGSTSWNDDVIGKVTPTIVTNGTTEITITFPAAADYSISAQDVISVSVPTTCLKWSESSAIAGDVSLNIIPIPATVDISTNKNDGSYFMESEIRSGSAQIIIAVSNDIFSTDVGDDNAVTTALIAGMIDAPIWVANVVSSLNYNNVFRLSDTEIRIDIPVVDYYISADEAVNFDVPASVFQNYASNINVNTAFSVVNEATTVSVTGTNQTEADIIDVGSTITLSLTGNEWDDQIDAGGAVTTALLNGITGSTSWNDDVIGKVTPTIVTNGTTEITITFPAAADYSISAQDVISVSVPTTCLKWSESSAIAGDVSLNIIPISATVDISTNKNDGSYFMESEIRSGSAQIIIAVSNDIFSTDVGDDNAVTTALIAGMIDAPIWVANVVSSLNYNNVFRLSDTEIRIDIPVVDYYISADEAVNFDVPASVFQNYASNINVNTAFSVVNEATTVSVTGTNQTEADIIDVGSTITLSLTGNEWDDQIDAGGAVTTALLNGITGSTSWNDDVIGKVTPTIVTNGTTEITITFPAAADYSISAQDVISVSVPTTCLKWSESSAIAGDVSLNIIPIPATVDISTNKNDGSYFMESEIRSGSAQIIIAVSNDIFSTDVGDDNAVTTALIAGMIDAPIWVANVVSSLNYNNVFRLSDTEIRIDIPVVDYYISADEAVNFDVPASVFQNYASNINVNTAFSVVNEATTVSVTGTNQTEADIIDVGSTITLSLTGNEWDDQIDAGGAVTTALLNGITGSTSWNDDVIGKVTPTIVTNGTTEITITFPAAADYSISAQDVISVSVPTTCLKWSESSAIAGDVSLNIIPIPATVDISTNKNDGSYFMESEIRSGSAQIIIAVSNDIFSTDVGDDNAVTTALIAGMIDAPIWVANVVSSLNYNNVFRLSDTEIRIDIPVVDYYISADEAVNFDVPASVFQNYASNINVNTAFSVVNEATTVSVTGTNQTEADIIDVGSTITLSLTGNEWDDQIDAGGAVTTALLNGITGSTSWNDDVIGKVTPTIVTNGTTEITITFPAAADYSISAQDVISVSVPTTCLKWSESSAIAGDVSLNIIPIPATVDISTNKNDGSYFMESEIRSGSAQIIIAVSNDIFSTDVGDDNAVTTALIAGMIDAPIWVANVVSSLNYNNVFRLSDTEIRIDIPVVDYYISADEAVNFDVPASVFQNYASNINVNTAFSVVNEATTVSVTGTNQTEADIIDVGSTITLSLTGNEWDDQIDAGGAVTTALLNGITGSTSWNDDVIGKVTPTIVTNGTTEITITFPAAADYSISAQDVISVSVPTTCLKWSESSAIAGDVSLNITPIPASISLSGSIYSGADQFEDSIRSGNSTIILTLEEDSLVANLGDDDISTKRLLEGISSGGIWDNEVISYLTSTSNGADYVDVVGQVVTISIPSIAAYNILSNESVSISVPNECLRYTYSGAISAGGFTIVAAPPEAFINDPGLTESNMDGNTLALNLKDETFNTSSLDASDFSQNGGTDFSITDASWQSATEVILTLGVNADFDLNVNNFKITAKNSVLTSGLDLETTNGITITAVKEPHINSIDIPARIYKIGDLVTVNISVVNDPGQTYDSFSGTIANQNLDSLKYQSDNFYKAYFTVDEFETDYASGDIIPVVDLRLNNGSILGESYNTDINKTGVVIDANRPLISKLQATSPGIKKIGDNLVIYVSSDEGFYDLVENETFVNGVPSSSSDIFLEDLGSGFYILHYTINENDGDVPEAGDMKAQIMLIDSAGNESHLKSDFFSNTIRIDSKVPEVDPMAVEDGIYSIGDTIVVTIAADGNDYDATNETTINGIFLTSKNVWFSNEGSNKYKLFYRVSSSDSEVAPGTLGMELYLKDVAGNITTPIQDIALNSLAIYTNPPSAVLNGNQEICEDDSAKLTVNLTGNFPWTINVSNGSDITEYTNIFSSPFEFYVKPDINTNYYIDLVRDVYGIESNSIDSVLVTVNPKTEVNIININPSYSIEGDPVILEADNPGGTFIGIGVIYSGSAYSFDPGIADTINSPHTIYYNYINIKGCHSSDSVEIAVLNGRGSILIPKVTFCDYQDPFIAEAENDASSIGQFTLIDDKGNTLLAGLLDNRDNTATINPKEIMAGLYTILYKYQDITGAILSLREDFNIQTVQTPQILNLDNNVFCQNEPTIELRGDIKDAIFYGNGVSGNVNSGFNFTPQNASVGTNTISYRYTVAECFQEVTEEVTVNYLPQINFTMNDQCVGGNDTIYFSNTTPDISIYKPSNWRWTFGDINSGPANISTEVNPFHIFTSSGLRNIEVMGETIDGCRDTLKTGIDFGIKPDGKIRWLTDCYVSGDQIDFEFDIDQAVTMDTYEWTFMNSPTDSSIINGSDKVQYTFPSESKYPIRLYLETSIGCSRTISDTLTLKPTILIGEQGYKEDFNDSNGVWAVEGADNTEYISWNYGLTKFSALGQNNSNAWYAVLSDNPLNELSAVVSPCFDFRGLDRPMVSMDIFRSLENNREGAVLEYSIDNKETWQEVGSLNDGLNWFNSFQIRNEVENQQFMGWTGVQPFTPDGSWVLAKHHLDYVKDFPNVRFRVLFASDHSSVINGREGFGFDNFRINSRTRKVVLEHFTNMSKAGIASVDETVNNVFVGNFSDLVKLEYHTDFNGPDQFNEDNPGVFSTRAFYYGVNTVPYSLLDGGGGNNELVYLYGNPSSYLTQEDVDLRALIDPLFDIDLDVSLSGQALTVDFTLTAKDTLPPAEKIIHTLVFEKHIADVITLFGVNDYYNVVKTMLPNAAGKADFNAWSANESKSYHYTWQLSNVNNSDSLRVAVFVQSDDTKEIYQAATNDSTPLQGFTSLRRMQVDELEMIMYPNPASDFVQLRLPEPGVNEYRVEIYDQLGKLIKKDIWYGNEEIKNITLSSFSNGVYFVRLKDEDGLTRSLKKLVIIKR
jgi:hypothetical protein